jgi:bifunctional non-homologous end joining protein LigD
MLASLIDAPIDDPAFVYEPKYDGIRAIVEVPAGGKGVRLWSRLGNEKTGQFPEIAEALTKWARRRRKALVLDGEIVAVDREGRPQGFQALQGRIHLREIVNARRGKPARATTASAPAPATPTAFIAFDLLREGTADLRNRPLTERRAELERVFGSTGSSMLRLSEQARGNGRVLQARALEQGWEGLIAKRADSTYQSGRRTPDWRKLKNVHEQEFVIGGWTEPRQTRAHFGALLLGVHEDEPAAPTDPTPPARLTRPTGSTRPARPTRGRLTYVGHVGTGFNERELDRVMRLLKSLEARESPFAGVPPANERPHWVKPELVAQVRFTEWTSDGYLRHPVYLGLRDDKNAENVRRETRAPRPHNRRPRPATGDATALTEQLRAIEASRRDGILQLPGGDTLKVTNLHKIFWPRQRYTKGDLFRYYAQVASFLLPAIAERPLVMKRFPNGINAPPFYQHRADDVPPGVRTAVVEVADRRQHIIGGDLKSLMYTTQLAAISQDPWFSRADSPAFADFVALDLDPSSGVSFQRVLDVARWIRDELHAVGALGVPKTSGASGLHVYVPLPRDTPYEAGLLFAQIVATVVARKHPNEATLERAVRARGKRVYIDCLQNAVGKTLASAYSARASDYAGVSTPLTWAEVEAGVEREAFTIATVPTRLREVGDLWKPLRESKGVNLSAAAARLVS